MELETTFTRATGQYGFTLWATKMEPEKIAKIQAEIAKIEAEKPKRQREPRQKWGFITPQPKRAPAYIGPSLSERVSARTWWDTHTRQHVGKPPLVTETIGGEAWWVAESRMKEVAEAIGWNKRDGLVPGDYIPRDMAEVNTLKFAGLRHAS